MGESASDSRVAVQSFIDVDLKDPKHYAVYLGQGGLGLPDRDYYLQGLSRRRRRSTRPMSRSCFSSMTGPSRRRTRRTSSRFETASPRRAGPRSSSAIPTRHYNPDEDRRARRRSRRGFAWDAFLDGAALGDRRPRHRRREDRVPEARRDLSPRRRSRRSRRGRRSTSPTTPRPISPRPFADAYFEMRNKTLLRPEEQEGALEARRARGRRRRLRRGRPLRLLRHLGWAVGQLYTAKYFPPAAKAKIEALVANLKAAYRARMQTLDWMAPATQAGGAQEARHLHDQGRLSRSVRATIRTSIDPRDDLVGNVRRAAAADWAFYAGRCNGPVDRSDWLMTPQTNDAYNGSLRDIVFPGRHPAAADLRSRTPIPRSTTARSAASSATS